MATHLSKKPNPHDTCTSQKESSKNFYSSPNVRKIQSQSNCTTRRPIIRPQIVVVTRAGGHIWWIRGSGHLCSTRASGIRGTGNVTGGSISSDVYKRVSLSSFMERGREIQRTLAKRRHRIFGFRIWVCNILSNGDGNNMLVYPDMLSILHYQLQSKMQTHIENCLERRIELHRLFHREIVKLMCKDHRAGL